MRLEVYPNSSKGRTGTVVHKRAPGTYHLEGWGQAPMKGYWMEIHSREGSEGDQNTI